MQRKEKRREGRRDAARERRAGVNRGDFRLPIGHNSPDTPRGVKFIAKPDTNKLDPSSLLPYTSFYHGRSLPWQKKGKKRRNKSIVQRRIDHLLNRVFMYESILLATHERISRCSFLFFLFYRIYDRDVSARNNIPRTISTFSRLSPRANLNFHYILRNEPENLPTRAVLAGKFITRSVSYGTFRRTGKRTNSWTTYECI